MHIFLTPNDGGIGLVKSAAIDLIELDVLYLVFAVATIVHCSMNKEMMLWISCLLGGLTVELGCIRGGGTHCHHSSLVDLSPCSSLNSVVFYAPWVYSAVIGARRMGKDSVFSQAMWTGLLTGLICWPYEMQGPLAKMWNWCDPATGVVIGPEAMGNFRSLANIPGQGMVTHAAALKDLSTQVFGFPIHAPFFDMAYGVGIGAALAMAPALPQLINIVCLGPVLGVVYIRLPILLADLLKTSVLVTDPCIMALTVVFAISTAKGTKESVAPDWLLSAGPMMNQLYWGAIALRLSVYPPELKTIILTITLGGVWVWYQVAAGPQAPPVEAKAKSGQGNNARQGNSWWPSYLPEIRPFKSSGKFPGPQARAAAATGKKKGM